MRREKIMRDSPAAVPISRSSNNGCEERRSSLSRASILTASAAGKTSSAVLPIIASRDIPKKRTPAPLTSAYRRSSARLTKIADGTLLMIRSRNARLRSRSCSAWRCSVISSKVATQPAASIGWRTTRRILLFAPGTSTDAISPARSFAKIDATYSSGSGRNPRAAARRRRTSTSKSPCRWFSFSPINSQ